MTYRPEVAEARTETQKLEDAIAEASATIRADWPRMIAPGNTQAPGRVNPSGVTLDDHDPRETDTRRIDRIMSHRRYAMDVLNGWCRVVMEDRPITNPKSLPLGTDVPGMCRFIETHAEWLSWNEAGDDIRTELESLAKKVHAIVSPAVKEWVNLGSCPLEVETADSGIEPVMETCNGQVRAWPRAEDRDGEVMARCRRCGVEAVTSWWESEMFKDGELKVLLTAEEVVTFVHRAFGKVIEPSTVRQWDSRKVIVAAERDSKGRKVYHRDALVWALAARERASST